MKLIGTICWLTTAIFFAFPSFGQGVPESAQGIWNLTNCTDDRAAFMINSGYALIFETDPARGQVVAMGPVSWSGGTAVLANGGALIILPPLQTMEECATLPPAFYGSFGETIALFLAFDGIAQDCIGQRGRVCANAIFGFADVSGDMRLSVAEISRIIRAVGVFAVYESFMQGGDGTLNGSPSSIKVPVQTLFGASMFVSVAGPIVTSNLLASYDFDADGLLALDEIMQDREPLLDYSLAAAAGTAFAQAAISSMVSTLVNAVSQLSGSLVSGVFR